jgi:hypothetical protein
MKKKPSLAPLLGMIAVIGLVNWVLNSNFEIGSYFEGLEVNGVEVLLEYLSLGLAFLTFGILLIVLIVRAARKDENLYWDFQADDFKEDQ